MVGVDHVQRRHDRAGLADTGGQPADGGGVGRYGDPDGDGESGARECPVDHCRPFRLRLLGQFCPSPRGGMRVRYASVACHDRRDMTEDIDLELEERHARRLVAGLPPERADGPEVEFRQLRLEGVVLVGVWTEGSATDAENSLVELAALAETAGSQVLDGLIQRRGRPDASTFIGRGKVAELRDVVIDTGADTVICDGELSPGQLRALEQETKVKVIDRTALILDIFAQHAKSKEGKAQVELAQLQYFLPRLRGWGEALSRQSGGSGRGGGAGGGVGLRGPGETKLEEVAEADLVLHVVDGSCADPEEQVRAVREVLADVGADTLPELLVINKIDAADEETLLRLKGIWPETVFCSARTGAGLSLVAEAVEARLPRPAVEVTVLVPYDRGDLVARVHRRGDLISSEHREDGTLLRVRVDERLAAELSRYAVAESGHPIPR